MLKLFLLNIKNNLSLKTSLVIVAMTVLLSGCLVHPERPKKFLRTTDSIHLYQPTDFIEYTVSGTFFPGSTSPQPVTGTLRIEWSVPANPLMDPVTGATVDALKEISTLTLNGVETQTVRYISQDANGSVSLHAFDKDISTSYWVNDSKTPSTTLAMNPVTLIQSPLAVTGSSYTIPLHVFDGCSFPGGCATYLGSQVETDKVESDNVDIRTDPGIFNTFSVSFSGSKLVDSGSGLAAFPIELDVRSACGLGNVTYSGTANVFPEVGVVYMGVNCFTSTNNESYIYYFSFKRAGGTIVLPSPA